MSQLQQKISDACIGHALHDIAIAMGYANRDKGVRRLNSVLDDPELGLLKPCYDGLFSSEAFIRKLLDILNLKSLMSAHEMTTLLAYANDSRFGFRPWMFVDTNFKRSSQPVFALAFMEGRRRIALTKSLKSTDWVDQLVYLKHVITEYLNSLKEQDGNVQLWGKPVGFYCHLSETHVLKLDLNGNLIEEINQPVNHGGARLTL